MIELSKNLTLGQYVNNGSLLTRLDPRAKIVSALFLIALFSYVTNLTAFIICFLCCSSIQAASRISISYVLRSFKPLILAAVIIYAFDVFFYNPGAQQTGVLWQWTVFSISWAGLVHGIFTVIRLFLLYYLTSMLTFSTSLVDLTNGSEALLTPLEKLGIPTYAFVMVLVIAFKFVPIFVTEVERLTKAQAARGVRFDKGNFIQRARKLAPLLIPLFISGFRRAEALTTAMEARCYSVGRRGWRRSKRHTLHFTFSDTLALLFVLAICCLAIGANILVHVSTRQLHF